MDATMRMTKANPLGNLNFGAIGACNSNDGSENFEGSAGVFVAETNAC